MSARLLAVVGTGTGVGKTVVAAALTIACRDRGVAVDAVRPVATGVPPGSSGEDAETLAAATGGEPADRVIATYAAPRSPLAAAAAEGTAVGIPSLIGAIVDRAHVEEAPQLLVLEGIGGVMVPLTDGMTVRDLVRRLDAPVLITARAGLGTINHTVLTVEACRAAGLRVLGVVLSDVDPDTEPDLPAENAEQISRHCVTPVLGIVPHLRDLRLGGAARAKASAPSDDPRSDDAGRPAADHGSGGGVRAASLREASRHLDIDAILASLGTGGPSDRIVAADRAHVWHPFTQTTEWLAEEPLVVRSGGGCQLIDERGRRYLDGVSSLWANVHGHAHPRLDAALRDQLGRIAHSTFLGQTHAPGALLAEELTAVAPAGLTRVFYSEAGAAAVEVALRVAILAHHHAGRPERTRIVSLDDGYHGDTAGAVSVGRSEPFHSHLDPLLFDALRAPSPFVVGEAAALEALTRLLAEHGSTVAALVLEPRVQAAAGIWPHSDGWLRAAADVARSHGALIICDEVATGFGRTGDLFASSGADVTPDILCLGKGIAAGYLPLSATLVTEELFELFTGPYTDHRTLYYGHTFSGNPLACAVARESLRLFAEEDTLGRARRLASRLAGRMPDITAQPMVKEVRQRGVMVGIQLAQQYGTPFDPSLRMGRRVTLAARQRGVIVRPLGDVVVINPPLVMSDGEADLLVSALANALASLSMAGA